MSDLAGLNRWERYWCRYLAFSPWSRSAWLHDVMLLLLLGLTVWSNQRRGLDPEALGSGFVVGVLLGALLVRNLPVRSDAVIARLTRALDGRGPP